MKFLIAPDSYKESMSAICAAKSIERGIKKIHRNAECEIVPMADGGEGTADCLFFNQDAEKIECMVKNPLGVPIHTDFVWLESKKTAIIEVAKACGMMLISSEEKKPAITTSYGVGEFILEALKMDCKEIILTLGGTVTNDGGMGMLLALGANVLDVHGQPVQFGGLPLCDIDTMDLSVPIELLKEIKITVLCDVKNKLLGENGATYIFGAQKGAKKEDLPLLEAAMTHYAVKIKEATGKDLANMEGSGAAGGIGCALFAISNAQFNSGAEYVMERLNLKEKIKNCDYVITGEGSIDAQSLQGKAPLQVANLARQYNKPVVVFAGKIEGSMTDFYDNGITAVFCILRGIKPMESILAEAECNLESTVENVARMLIDR